MSTKNMIVLVFFGILVIHSVAILLFTRGFLLTRTELPHYSSCADILQSPCFFKDSVYTNESRSFDANEGHHSIPRGCWTKPAVDRLIVIVLDALRFDFVAPSTFFEEKKPWMDKLPVLHKLASQPGSSAKIFKAFADPPTTSLQRLKGLTTGGLPTFVDVGNSFGAPAIVEDNFIYQLAQNGKRVVMMGDDTWLQLFPHHFNKSYPFPSFNVKDLHTVDDGCIKHLFPLLHSEDWDVLIAHFLGVDHAGHMSGVDSIPMVQKLEQYNDILEKVVEVLESQSKPGGLHENTLLLVTGDHGQTINGDHGGGSAEEVTTSIFALSLKPPPSSVPLELDTSSCQILDGRKICVSSIQQLDFAVTVSALLGVSFPFGSIGRVNPELYALAAGTWNLGSSNMINGQTQPALEEWLQNYVNVLCINSWQVKKYIDVYSTSSVIGFSNEDLLQVSDLYAQAQKNWPHAVNKSISYNNECSSTSLPALKMQAKAYFDFLARVSELARSKWTEFDLKMMGMGLCVLLVSPLVQFFSIRKLGELSAASFPSNNNLRISFLMIFACIVVVIRAFSFLSNSYILQEGKVASFLLASIGILYLRYSIIKMKMLFEAVVFVLLIPILRFTIEIGLSKQAVNSLFLKISPPWMLEIAGDSPVLVYISEIGPVLALTVISYMLYKSITSSPCKGGSRYVIFATIISYLLIAGHWTLQSDTFNLPLILKCIKGNSIPRIIYAGGFLQLLFLTAVQVFNKQKTSDWAGSVTTKAVVMLSAWSSTIIILSGKQGPLVALASIIGGWCIMRLSNLEDDVDNGISGTLTTYFSPVTKWSLLAVCLFFCTGHWCAFDGLRYAAAFIGFDEFNLIRQAILLAIDTFGFSHIIPILGLPFLVTFRFQSGQTVERKQLFTIQLFFVYLMYGLGMSINVIFTILCVTIQRRHLMVWGLFAPKFVFDVVGLLLTDVIICVASLYYID